MCFIFKISNSISMDMNYSLNKIGFWSALLSALLGLTHMLPQVLSEIKLIPNSKNLEILLLPTLFMAITFLTTMLCLHYAISREFKIWTAMGVVFSIVYFGSIALIYFDQLAQTYFLKLSKTFFEKIFLVDQNTLVLKVNILGYCFTSLSTFFVAFAFKKHKWLYRSLVWNGILLPFLILSFFYSIFYLALIFWIVSFPMCMIHSAVFFRYSISNTTKAKL